MFLNQLGMPKVVCVIPVFHSSTKIFQQGFGLADYFLRRNVFDYIFYLARRLRAKFWPDCAIPDTSMKFGTVVDHD